MYLTTRNVVGLKGNLSHEKMQQNFFFSWRYNPRWGLYIFYSPLAGFSLLAYEVSRSHTTTRHSR